MPNVSDRHSIIFRAVAGPAEKLELRPVHEAKRNWANVIGRARPRMPVDADFIFEIFRGADVPHQPVGRHPISFYPILEHSSVSRVRLQILLAPARIGLAATTQVEGVKSIQSFRRVGL